MTVPSVEEVLPPSAHEFKVQLQRALKACNSRRDKLVKCEQAIYESTEGLEECQIQVEVARQIVRQEKLYTEAHESLKRWEQSLRLDKKQLDCSQNHRYMIERYSRQFYRRTNAWPWDTSILVSQQQPTKWSRQLLEGLAKLAGLQRDVDKISDSLQEAMQLRAGRGSKKRGLSKVDKLVPADIYTVIKSMEQGIAMRDINVKGISKQPKKRKKDEEQNDTCAPNKRSKRGKGGNGIGSKPGKGPKGRLAGGKGSKKGRPGQGKDPEEDTAADEGSDRENTGEEASEKESAAGDNINTDSAAGDGTRRASRDIENSIDEANGGESGTDIEDIAGGSVGGTEDAVAGSIGEEDNISEGIGGYNDRNVLVGGYDIDVTTTQVEPLSTTTGVEDTAAQEAGQEDTTIAEIARGEGDHITTKSAGGEVTITDQNAGKEDTAASGIAEEETTTPEVVADAIAFLKTTGPLSGGNEVIVPQESPALRLGVGTTEVGAQKDNGQRAVVEEAPENKADFSSMYQAVKPANHKTPPQESPHTPQTRAARARFPNTLPTPPQSDQRRILHQPKGVVAHLGSPNCPVDVLSDGESGEALAHQVATYKAASHMSGDRIGTSSPDPLEQARNDAGKAIDEINTRLTKCEEILAPSITSIPEIANGLREIAAEMAGPYKRLRALKERAIMLYSQARR